MIGTGKVGRYKDMRKPKKIFTCGGMPPQEEDTHKTSPTSSRNERDRETPAERAHGAIMAIYERYKSERDLKLDYYYAYRGKLPTEREIQILKEYQVLSNATALLRVYTENYPNRETLENAINFRKNELEEIKYIKLDCTGQEAKLLDERADFLRSETVVLHLIANAWCFDLP